MDREKIISKKIAAMFKPEQTRFVTEEVNKLLIQQITNELIAHYTYLAMSSWLKSVGLEGFSKWMKAQAKEEAEHAEKIMDFLNETGSVMVLQAISAPKSYYESAMEVAEEALRHEKMVTADWYKIFDTVQGGSDWAVVQLAQWFLDEQIQEEDNAVTLVQRVKLAGEGAGLLVFDCELSKR